jgi:hypothetical protein
MTRLTDEQIDNVVHDVRQALGGKAWYRHFADRIAALAVQEVERERNVLREYLNNGNNRRYELAGECESLRAQLATAKREGFVNGAAWGAKNYLFSAKHQVVLANEQASREYPATPSGESENDQCACGDVAVRNWEGYAFCAKCCATPSPEAREVREDKARLEAIVAKRLTIGECEACERDGEYRISVEAPSGCGHCNPPTLEGIRDGIDAALKMHPNHFARTGGTE